MTLALLFSGAASTDTHDGFPSDGIKRQILPPAPKGTRYLHQRPEEPPIVLKTKRTKKLPKLKPIPITAKDLEGLANVLRDKYPQDLFRLLDISEFDYPVEALDLLRASKEAEALQALLDNQLERDKLKTLLNWALNETKALQIQDDEELLVMIMSKKRF